MIVEMDMYSEIRIRYSKGESIRSISQSLGVSRQTVRKYCEGDTHPESRKEYKRKPSVITEDVEVFILNCFDIDLKENIKKQRHTAKRIYDRLLNEMDFKGSYSTIRATVRKLRAEQSVPPQSDMPLAYEPGEATQIDWGEATIYLGGQKLKINLFCGRLCNSCDIYVQAYRLANQETFLEAQQRMFDYFGGITRRIIFDNAKVAVKEGFGLHAKPQDKYLSFSAHYAFTLDFCNPAKGNEKGLVENLVGYARRNFLVPVPRIDTLESLNELLQIACLKYRNEHRINGRNGSVATLYEQEKRFLTPIPRFRFDTSKTRIAKVDDFSTVRYEKNNYSVPTRYLRKEVTVKGYADALTIHYQGTLIATYNRSYGSGKTQYRLEHYIDLLERKSRSVFNARPVRDNITQELQEWGRYLPGGNKEMVKLLRLCLDYGEDKILSIKRNLPSQVIPTVDIIRGYLNEPTDTSVVYLKQEIQVLDTDLSKYDRKFGVVE